MSKQTGRNEESRRKKADKELQNKWLTFTNGQKNRYVKLVQKKQSKEVEYQDSTKKTTKRAKPASKGVEKSAIKANKRAKAKWAHLFDYNQMKKIQDQVLNSKE